MRIRDFRSDTVTQQTQEMRVAMLNAEVGDDVFQDDPSVNELERLGAEITGKESCMFVSSGTMGNLLAVMSNTRHGDEIICGVHSHLFTQETGGPAAVAGVSTKTLDYPNDYPDAKIIEENIRIIDILEPQTKLICLENALANGRVVTVETMKEIYEMAHRHGIPVHVDGARIWNASVALGVDVKELTQYCDTITCCLSKGLCGPVGALLCGSKDFVIRARKFRKMIGGGMRQCGFLAAAGIVALDMRSRLIEDHNNAKYLAEKLSKFKDIHLDLEAVQINMVFCEIDRPENVRKALPDEMMKRGIRICGEYKGKFRFMTNHDVNREDVDYLVEQLADILNLS